MTGMQQKTINLGNWLTELINTYVPECPEKGELQTFVRDYFVSEENYNTFMFSIVPSVCSVPKTKNSIIKVRSLKDTTERESAITNAQSKLKLIKAVVDAVLAMPTEELDAIVLKLVLYVNLFTDMYFK